MSFFIFSLLTGKEEKHSPLNYSFKLRSGSQLGTKLELQVGRVDSNLLFFKKNIKKFESFILKKIKKNIISTIKKYFKKSFCPGL
jgi:hypothetical protein